LADARRTPNQQFSPGVDSDDIALVNKGGAVSVSGGGGGGRFSISAGTAVTVSGHYGFGGTDDRVLGGLLINDDGSLDPRALRWAYDRLIAKSEAYEKIFDLRLAYFVERLKRCER
jgi:hypothetical protein